MSKPLPRFALRYIPGKFFGGVPKYKVPEKSKSSEWTLVAPKDKHRLIPNVEALEMWTESATFAKGKREGWATWTNTKTDVSIRVEFKNDIVQSLRYYCTSGKICSYCQDNFYTSVEYNQGRIIRSSTSNCSCGESFYGDYPNVSCGYSCTCGSSVELQWDHSLDLYDRDHYSGTSYGIFNDYSKYSSYSSPWKY